MALEYGSSVYELQACCKAAHVDEGVDDGWRILPKLSEFITFEGLFSSSSLRFQSQRLCSLSCHKCNYSHRERIRACKVCSLSCP